MESLYSSLRTPSYQTTDSSFTRLGKNHLSFGKAQELAGLSKAEFHRLLGERGVERHYTEEDLALDVEYAREYI